MSEYDDPNAPPDLLGRDIAAAPPDPSLEDIARRGGIRRESLADLKAFAPPIPGWNAPDFPQRLEDLDRRAKMSVGENLGEFGEQAAPIAASAVVPGVGKTIGTLARAVPKGVSIPTLAGGALLAGSSEAGEPAKPPAIGTQFRDELAKLLQEKEQIAGQIEAARQRRESFRPQGRRPGGPDQDPQFNAANDEYNGLMKRSTALDTQIGPAREAAQHEGALAETQTGNTMLENAQNQVGPVAKFLREYAGPSGYVAGFLGSLGLRKLVQGGSDKLSKLAADKAEALFTPKPKGIDPRVSAVNEFWARGQPRPLYGGKDVPFEVVPGGNPAFRSTPGNVPPAADLYQPPRVRQLTTDALTTAGFGGEWAYGQGNVIPEAKEKEANARAELAHNPTSQVAIDALQAAKNEQAWGEFLQNMGRSGVVSYPTWSAKFQRNPSFPSTKAAEADRMALERYLNKRSPPGAGPPALPGGGGNAGGGNLVGPGVGPPQPSRLGGGAAEIGAGRPRLAETRRWDRLRAARRARPRRHPHGIEGVTGSGGDHRRAARRHARRLPGARDMGGPCDAATW
jgi:hypothetical protein